MNTLQGLAGQMLEITLALSVVIAALLLLRPLLKKRYRAKLFYWVWLVVALRMVILWNPTLPEAPVQIPTTDAAIVYTRTEPVAGQGTPAVGQWSISTGQAASIPTVPEKTGELLQGTPDVSSTVSKQLQKTSTMTLTLAEVFTLLWLAGALAFLGANLLIYARFRRRVRRWKSPEEDPAVLARFEALRGAAGVKRLTLARCNAIFSPLVTGFVRPQLLLPQETYSAEALDAVFRHELVHTRRRDLWYKLLLLAARSVHWFNPLVHLMARQAGRDLELSCDEAVLSGQDEDFRKSYGRTILSAVEGGVRRDAPLTSYFHGGKAALLERLKAIVSGGGKRRGIALICVLVLLVGVVAAACSVAAAAPGDVPDDTPDSQPSGSDLFGQYDPFPVDPYEPTVTAPVEPGIAPEELLGMLPRTYWFHSGAGGWRTELNLGEDGTFSGDYKDSDATVTYFCRFWGTFAQPERIAPFTWSLKIESMATDGTPGAETEIGDTRYIPADGPYGLENTDELLLYLPGARIADLPQDLLRAARVWAYCLPEGEGSLSNYEYLPFYGLYNPAEDAGFIASEDGYAVVADFVASRPVDPTPSKPARPTLEGVIFKYGDRSYDMSERNQMINAVTSCIPVGKYIIVEGHTGPKHSIYSIFNTETQEFEKDIVGANLTFYNDDINTVVYSFWSDIYTYDGTLIGSCELGENEYIGRLNLSFLYGNTQVVAIARTGEGIYTKAFDLP